MLFPLPPILLADREPAFGFAARQPLVLGYDRHRHPLAESLDELKHPCRFRAGRPIQVPWQPHHHRGHPIVFGRQTADRGGDLIECSSLHDQRPERPRQESGGIADRKSDALLSDIQTDDPHDVSIVSLPLSTRIRLAALVWLLSGFASVARSGQDGSVQAERLARRAAERLTALHQEADRLAAEARTLLTDLRALEVERQIRREELRQVEAEQGGIARELATLDRQITALEQQVRLDLPRLRTRLVDVYKMGQGRYARLLLSTTDMANLTQAVRLASGMAALDRSRVDLYETRRRELESARATLQDRRGRLRALRADAASAARASEAAVAARNALIADIDRQRDLNAQLEGELQAAQQRLQDTVRGLPESGLVTALPLGPFRGDLTWPVSGTVRQGFGAARTGAPVSNGLDIAAPESAAVAAVHEGTVVFAAPFSGFGLLVIVDHGNQAYSLYGNLREAAVTPGARVAGGDPIGTAGLAPTGASGLYFELRIDGRPVDPLQWLKHR